MNYQRAAWKALYRLISEGHVTEKESLAIAQSIFFPSVIEVPSPQECEYTPAQQEAEKVVVKGFAGGYAETEHAPMSQICDSCSVSPSSIKGKNDKRPKVDISTTQDAFHQKTL